MFDIRWMDGHDFLKNTLGDVLLIFDTMTSHINGGITKNATSAFNIEIKA